MYLGIINISKVYLFYLKKREREKEIYLLDHSPSSCNSQSLAGPKLGTRTFFQVFQMGAAALGFGPFAAVSQAIGG